MKEGLTIQDLQDGFEALFLMIIASFEDVTSHLATPERDHDPATDLRHGRQISRNLIEESLSHREGNGYSEIEIAMFRQEGTTLKGNNV